MTPMILLRDDDPNATTDVDRLARAYAPLLDAGLPINFSVIPEVALDTMAPDGLRERFIHDDAPRTGDLVPITVDMPITRWLRRHPAQLGVMQHGHTHRRGGDGTEFGVISRRAAAIKMDRGGEILEQAFGCRPNGFVPPWDVVSRGTIDAAHGRFDLVSCNFVSRSRLPLSAWPAYVIERRRRSELLRVGNTWVSRHRGGQIQPDMDPASVGDMVHTLTDGAHLGVIVLHHWMFWNTVTPHPVIVALAEALHGRRVVTVDDAITNIIADELRASA